MPAKKIVYEKDVVEAALDIIREKGENSLNARDIAKKIGCSTQPLYSLYKNMAELEDAVRQAAARVLDEYMKNEMGKKAYPNPNKAIGMGYIRFASEEKNLYRFLFMRKRQIDSAINVEMTKTSIGFIKDIYSVDSNSADMFFAELWIFCHGIASMVAADTLDFDEEKISSSLTDVALGLSLRFGQMK